MNKLFLLFLLMVAPQVFGQSGYQYRRKLSGIHDEWHRIELPDDLFDHLQSGLNDIRIKGIVAPGDTVEAPYLLHVEDAREKLKLVPMTRLNKVQRDGAYFYTFQSDEGEVINQIDLEFSLSDYNWNVRLEGSHNRKDWFTVTDHYRILSFDSPDGKLEFNTLYFPDADFTYYRIRIPTDSDPFLRSARLWHRESDKGTIRRYQPESFKVYQDGQKTIVDISLKHATPVEWITLKVDAPYDYYRETSVYCSREDTLSPDESRRGYVHTGFGVLNSIRSSGFHVGNVIARHWRLVIDNFDNDPLDITGAEFSGPVHTLIARFTEDADYFLVYGKKTAYSPRYDVTHFLDLLPEKMTSLRLGKEEEIAAAASLAEQPSVFRSEGWIWAIMSVVILVLGWFTLKMLRDTGSR